MINALYKYNIPEMQIVLQYMHFQLVYSVFNWNLKHKLKH